MKIFMIFNVYYLFKVKIFFGD